MADRDATRKLNSNKVGTLRISKLLIIILKPITPPLSIHNLDIHYFCLKRYVSKMLLSSGRSVFTIDFFVFFCIIGFPRIISMYKRFIWSTVDVLSVLVLPASPLL